MTFGTGSWPEYELFWPQAATPSTAWIPRPPPLLPPNAPSPHSPHPLWPTEIPPTHPLGALLRSSSVNLLTTSQPRLRTRNNCCLTDRLLKCYYNCINAVFMYYCSFPHRFAISPSTVQNIIGMMRCRTLKF